MRAMDNPDSAEQLMEANRIYYNFIRPHMALNNDTPAQRAWIDLGLGKNKWKGLIKKAIEHRAKNGAH